MKKKPALANPDALNAARRVIAEARESRKATDDDGVRIIVTGVPRPGDGIDWPVWKPPAKSPVPSASAPQPKRTEPPPAPPTEWTYVYVQVRAPNERDQGQITERPVRGRWRQRSFS
jgi:hypothetical protein